MQRLEFRAMGSRILTLLEADAPEDAAQEVPGSFEGWEQVLSRFRSGSELSRLNGQSGQWVRVSTVLWHVLCAALAAAEQSNGLVTPTLLNALEAAGYDRSFESIGASQLKPETIQPVCDWRSIEVDAPTRSVRLPAGVRLDLGGIAKGWAADRAARRLARHGPALVNAGGDIAISGPRAEGEQWPIGVTDPHNPDEPIELLMVGRGGVATSGRDYHRWQQASLERHHILDPRTGLPAATDVFAATVIGPSAEQAEVAAKTTLILGSRDGLRWLEERPQFAGLLVLENGQALYSRRLSRYLPSS